MNKSHALTVLPPFSLSLRLDKHLLAVFGLHHVRCVFITFRQFFPSPEHCICSAPHSSIALSSMERFTRVPLVPSAITFTFFSSFERSRQDLKPCYYPKRHAESAHPQCFRLLHTSPLAFPPALPPPPPISSYPVLLLPPWRAVTQEPMQR